MRKFYAFAGIGNFPVIIVGEHFVAEYCICNTWCVNGVHFQAGGSGFALLCFTAFKGFQWKGRCWSNHILQQEDVYDRGKRLA
jgi:hypothetical protein